MQISSSKVNLVQAHECLSACLGNIINLKYSFLSGSEIIILGDGDIVFYDTNRKVIGAPMYEANIKFLNKYQFDYEHKQMNDKLSFYSYVKDKLEENKFLVIKVNAGKLNYNRVFRQTNNAPHFLNIIELENDQVKIADSYVPTREGELYEGWRPLSEILSAWEDQNFEYFYINKIPEINIPEIQNQLVEKFKNYLMTNINTKYENERIYGNKSIYHFFEYYLEENINTKENMLYANYQLQIFGFLSVREIWGQVLPKLGVDINLIQKYKEVIEGWKAIGLLYMKTALSRKEEKKNTFLRKVDEQIQKEESVYKSILDCWR